MPAAARLAERVRRDPRPRRRATSASGPPTSTVPAARRYLPGHDGARDELGDADRLDHRPRRAAHRALAPRGRALAGPTAARRPTTTPTTCCCARSGASTARCRSTLDCEPVFDYGRAPGRLGVHRRRLRRRPSRARRGHRRSSCTLTTDLRLGFEGGRAHARARCSRRASAASCALSWSEHAPPTDLRRGLRAAGVDRAPLAALARPRPLPRPSVAQLPAAQRADAQGPDLRADRRARSPRPRRRCPRRPAASATGTTATRWIRDSTFALWALYTLGFDWEANDFFYFIADVGRARTTTCRSCTASAASASSTSRRSTTCTATRARGRCGSATAPTTSSSTTSGARCSTRSTCTPSRATSSPSASGRSSSARSSSALEHWREPDRGIWEVRGEPQALHLVEGDVLGGASTAAPAWPGCAARTRARRALAGERPTRSTPTSARNGVDERGVFTQHYDTDALDASLLLMPLVRFLPADDPRIRGDGAGDRRRADRGRPGAALPGRGDRRRPRRARRARSRSARSGWCRRSSRSASSDRARALCEKLLVVRQPARALRRGDRPATGRHLGNFPQAFTHLALINAVMHVIRAEEDAAAARSPVVGVELSG